MEEFRVITKRLQSSGNDIAGMSADIRSMGASIRSIRSNLRSKIVREEEIGRRLKEIADTVDQIDGRLSQYGNKAVAISSLYDQAERRITGSAQETVSKAAAAGGAVIAGAASGSGGAGQGAMGGQGTADEDGDNKVSWISGSVKKDGQILGVDSSGKLEGDIFGASYEKKFTNGLKWEEKDDGHGNKVKTLTDVSLIEGSIAGEAHVASGSASGNIGLLSGEAKASVGKVAAEGSVAVALIKDGKLTPQIDAKAEVSAVGAEGEANVSFGTENTDVHGKAEGKVLVAEASAEAGIGMITYESKDGETKTGYGVKGEVGAEAYVAEGKVSGGFSILGIKIDAGVGGKLGGAGASAGGHVTTGSVGGSVSLGFLAGIELDLNIDWSGFKWGW